VSGGPAIGTIQLHLGPAAPNDDLADATPLTGLPVATTGDTAFSTHETNENAHAGIVGFGSIWYAWTAPSTGNVLIDTCGSSVDTQLGVYANGGAFPLTEIDSNNDDCGTASRVFLSATASTIYLIAIDGAGGPVVLNISDANFPTTSIDKSVIRSRRHRAKFFFSGTVPAGTLSFECKFDNGVFKPCVSPLTRKHLRGGMHTFYVRATNGTLVDPVPESKTFKIRR